MTIGERVKKRREEIGMSVDILASKLGFGFDTVLSLEMPKD